MTCGLSPATFETLGHVECEAEDGEDAFDLAKVYDYDVIVFGDRADRARDFVRKCRRAKVATPIVVLSNFPDSDEIAAILNEGGDDVMRAQVHKDELHARINAVVRRSQGITAPTLDFGNLALDLNAHTIRVAGKPVHLTGKEAGILEALARRAGITQSKDALLTALYQGRDEPELKIIDVFVCKLRKKLTEAGWDGAVITVRGRGYRIDPDGAVERSQPGDKTPIAHPEYPHPEYAQC